MTERISAATADPSSATTAAASAGAAITPITAAMLRAHTISYVIHGSTRSGPCCASCKPALARLSAIVADVCKLASNSSTKSIRQLLDDWHLYSHLLVPSIGSNVPRWSWDAHQQAALVISQHTELQEALSALQSISLLVNERKLLDSAKSIASATHVSLLQHLQLVQLNNKHNHDRTHSRLLALVSAWSHYTSTLSRAFTLLDAQLWQLERDVSAIERQRAPASRSS